jgi:2-polyprenyl-3-methyl-5-hydroxy-6-metoxy-1,4-benzoquinol methylase
LRRLNWLMRHAPLLCAGLKANLKQSPAHLVEIGAGDGSLLLAVARQMHACWPGVRVSLVDRQQLVSAETLARFHQLGWPAEVVVADAFDWLAAQNASDVILANFFLHHFADERLSELLRLIAARTGLFLASETRRTWPSFTASRLLALLGCNSVTRNDAILSLKAGFRDHELTALWPKDGGWQLEERRAAVFTHLFIARRRS